MDKNKENERANDEEVLIIYYASRNVSHKSIAEIIKMKYGHDHSESEIMEKVASIQKKTPMKSLKAKWVFMAVDNWMLKQVGKMQELHELIKMKPEVWEIIEKNGLNSFPEDLDLKANYLYGFYEIPENLKNWEG